MGDKSSSEQSKGNDANFGIKGDVKSFQQLSSSADAAKKKRNDNHIEKAFGALSDAARDHFGGAGHQDQGSSGTRPQ